MRGGAKEDRKRGPGTEGGGNSELRWLADSYWQAQKTRIAFENRLRAVRQGRDQDPPSAEAEVIFGHMVEAERLLIGQMERAVQCHPAWEFLSQIKGIGPILGSKLVGLIGEIGNFDTVSKLWRYAGMAVINGRAERPIKGEKLHYNARLRSTMFLIGTSFLRSRNKYSALYYKFKVYYQENRDWRPIVVHNAARRKMVKIFLEHLWERWRLIEGLPIRLPYVIEVLGHTNLYTPKEFADREAKPSLM